MPDESTQTDAPVGVPTQTGEGGTSQEAQPEANPSVGGGSGDVERGSEE